MGVGNVSNVLFNEKLADIIPPFRTKFSPLVDKDK